MLCKNCGRNIGADDMFCQYCRQQTNFLPGLTGNKPLQNLQPVSGLMYGERPKPPSEREDVKHLAADV